MNIWTLVGAIGFPPVAALHAYSVEYGYRGVTRAEAWGKAKSVLIGAAIVSILVLVATAALAQPVMRRSHGGTGACPDGYHASGSGCVGNSRDTPPAMRRDRSESCPSGTYASGDYCRAYR
ncbi:MAG: hypothetical protein KDK08_05940 [Rhizobiaceae bacterium]|nr:hypothetical protein [Rhizobiaceae bacterium]MCC0001000.1 hypothetical protein [Methylobacteriaceae bacterium]